MRALPTEDSYFYQWDSAGLADPLASESGGIPMIGASTNIIVTLLERPDLKALDLLGGLGGFPDGGSLFTPRAKPVPIR